MRNSQKSQKQKRKDIIIRVEFKIKALKFAAANASAIQCKKYFIDLDSTLILLAKRRNRFRKKPRVTSTFVRFKKSKCKFVSKKHIHKRKRKQQQWYYDNRVKRIKLFLILITHHNVV